MLPLPRMIRLLLAYGLVLSLLPALAAGPAMAQQAVREIEVTVDNFTFTPDHIEVSPGETVRFRIVNRSETFHTFTLVLAPENRQAPLADVALQPGETATALVTMPAAPGQLYLFCRPHEPVPMKATVTVGAPAAQAPAAGGQRDASDQAGAEQAGADQQAGGDAGATAPQEAPTRLPQTGDGSAAAHANAVRQILPAAAALLVLVLVAAGLGRARRAH